MTHDLEPVNEIGANVKYYFYGSGSCQRQAVDVASSSFRVHFDINDSSLALDKDIAAFMLTYTQHTQKLFQADIAGGCTHPYLDTANKSLN